MLPPLAVAIFLALVAERLVAAFITPIWEKFEIDKFWLLYVAWVVGGGLVWLSGANVFAEYLPSPLAGKILTSIVAGGGANLLHDLFDTKPAT